jgi:glycosyltransferase involved in cell wall biosynthesis
VIASTELLTARLATLPGVPPPKHLPVGSNLPDRRSSRSATRRRLRIEPTDVVIVSFGTGHPSQLAAVVASAAAAAGDRTVLLNLGAGAPPVDLAGPARVLTSGYLPDGEVAEWLSAGDIYVAALSDGVSTRRTTLMAAFQHELAVVATDGSSTDSMLRRNPRALRLIDVERPDDIADAVADLARDADQRRSLAREGRQLYDDTFAWPVICRELIDILGSGP